ncbi:TOBE domain-containing protein [Erysipelothrix sp. D19-032]
MIRDNLVEFDGTQFECVDHGFDENEKVDIVIRPEDIDIVDVELGKLTGIVDSILFKGVHYEIVVKTDNREFIIHTTDISEVGKEVGIHFFPEDIHVMYTMESY